jgi:hypothetical protein
MDRLTKPKKLEVFFFAVFSVVVLTIFYIVISMNGVVLGNDPAVHLEKAQIFLNTQQIPLSTVSWTPPLYEIVLAMFISLSGANDIGQFIFMVKVVTVIVNWIMVMSVYLLASKFFTKKVGVAAAILLLMCFPIFELNQWGGCTTVLGIGFMLLLLTYLPLSVEKTGYLVVTFFFAFSVVLTHQLATFVAFFILPPILLFMLIKSRGASLKVIIALIFGGGIAFFIYYFHAMIGYLGELVYILFFSQKTYAYQIGATTLHAYTVNFGFLLLLAIGGVYLAYKTLRATKRMLFFLVLVCSFVVPFFFAQSYLVGLFLPFQWFIYYLTPPLAIFAAVTAIFLIQKAPEIYQKHRASFRKNWVKAVTVALIVIAASAVVVRAGTVYGKILEAGTFYSTTDPKAYDAGLWLRDNYPENSTVVVSENPGFWFQEFSGKSVIAQTNPIIERNEVAESVLSLSYEIEHPQTMLSAYEAKGDISQEIFVPLDMVWNQVAYTSRSGDFINYTQQGTVNKLTLNHMAMHINLQNQTDPKQIQFIYTNDNITLTKTVRFQNTSYPLDVSWAITPLQSDITDVTLYLSTFFDLQWKFDAVEIPGLLDWVNPWDAPEPLQSLGPDWTTVNFVDAHLTGHYLGLYDDTNDVAYAFNFTDLPSWGNIGALLNRQIDAIRFQYQYNSIGVNQTATSSYEVLALAKNSYPTLSRENLEGIFSVQVPPFPVETRDFRDYMTGRNVGFIVYDKNQLDTKMINNRLLQLIYSNDRYAIFKIANQT